ncbi:GTPase Era [Arachidicoccus ginsenosidivorans]|jgi:GTP-binding protein Era|uniref:GTPase Era n=1 Tax=Arachidicoccus ginsenosidivorans TaxID=496057 RepID=A0A5B8VRF9_9BACT|nr:GTPase Era [Arachidicoccus ginsenosidivorans]QEC72868.1 GTPase Era [Arachidicoccus ginsenosidivorans]
MKSGFVNIFGKPNAGKSTLLNALLGEKLAIVSSKVQTTRHRIKGFLNKKDEYQIILSDTPGIIEPKYKLHQKMMGNVKSALEDADVAVLLVDIQDDLQQCAELFNALKLRVPCIIALNKIDVASPERVKEAKAFFAELPYCKKVVTLSALNQKIFEKLTRAIVELLPEGMAFYDEDELTDLPTKFFVGELIREKIYQLFQDEIPYHTAVMVNAFKEKQTLTKIQADIIVQRETQKMILIGEKGKMIKKIGTLAREDIEKFLEQKVFLELFVKVRPKWRENDAQLKEYGYN